MNIVDDNDLPLTVPAQLHIEWGKKKKKKEAVRVRVLKGI